MNWTVEQLKGEIAAIWARLNINYVDEAREMAYMLTTPEERDRAIMELVSSNEEKEDEESNLPF